MTYKFITIDGDTTELKNPISVKISKDKDAPADSILIQFPVDSIQKYQNNIKKFAYIKIYNDENCDLVFDGLVDEQIVEVSEDGLILEISGRSIACLLLDNEALPQTYYLPSLKTIFERHVKPYGFTGYKGSDTAFSGKFVVQKGMSEWDVLYNFCTEFLGVEPKITPARVINVTENTLQIPLKFSNKDNEIKYTYISEIENRYEIISEVNVRAEQDGNYSMKFINDTATKNDIIRKRYVNSVDDITPASTAQKLIDKGNEEAYQIALNCPCQLIGELDMPAIVDDDTIGYMTGLKIKSIIYTLNSNKENCRILLNKGVE